jgi:putative ABC transport system permease protein
MLLALRSLWKTPSFSVVALLSLALGIGANTAIFSVIDALLLRPLPFDRPETLVFIQENRQGRQPISVSYPNFRDWKAQTSSLERMAARQGTSYTLVGHGLPQQIEGSNVTAELFPLLGVKPVLGRTFLAEEDKPGAEPVVVITYGLWQRMFNGSAGALGEQLNLDGELHSIIGVMPAGFRYPYTHLKGEIFTSLGRLSGELLDRGSRAGLYILARLKPNASLQGARADLNTIAQRLRRQYPAANHGVGIDADLLQERMVRGIRPALLVVMVAVSLVMLIACANVASLLLARAASRQREMAIRSALGAGRRHLIRQLLTEGVALSFCGGVLGTLFATASVRGLAAITPSDTPRVSEIAFNGRALLFTLAISAAAGILFGLVPLWEAGRRDLYETIKRAAAGASGAARQRARSALVIAEVALSTALLIGVGLLLSSFTRLSHTSAGLQPEHVTALLLSVPETAYATPAARAAFGERLVGRVQSLPGVQFAGLVHPLPLSGFGNQIGGRARRQVHQRPAGRNDRRLYSRYAGLLPHAVNSTHCRTPLR